MQKLTVEEGNPFYLLGIPIAGLVLGFGIRSLYWSFGNPTGKDLNQDFAQVGFNGLDNISLLGAADYSIGLVVAGAATLIALNAGAWRRTGGY